MSSRLVGQRAYDIESSVRLKIIQPNQDFESILACQNWMDKRKTCKSQKDNLACIESGITNSIKIATAQVGNNHNNNSCSNNYYSDDDHKGNVDCNRIEMKQHPNLLDSECSGSLSVT